MAVASALSYANEGETRTNVLERLDWHAHVTQRGRAQALLLMNENEQGDRPVIIIAFRGTELPDQEKEGWREFYPDWLRNIRFSPHVVEIFGGFVAGEVGFIIKPL